MKVCKSPLPENSRIVRYPDANYRDCFRCRLQIPGKVSPNQVMAAFWTTSPAWLKFLFRLRDLLVRPFGLKTGEGPSREKLEEALNNYSGTVLYVSHDRYFINQTCSRILELVNQTFVNYIGNYDYYLEKKEELTRAYASAPAVSAGIAPSESSSDNQTESKLSWQEQKEQQAKERKRKNDLKKTEEEIAKLEERNTVIDEELTKEEIYSNSIECQKLSTERAENEEKLEALYERWEELAEEV